MSFRNIFRFFVAATVLPSAVSIVACGESSSTDYGEDTIMTGSGADGTTQNAGNGGTQSTAGSSGAGNRQRGDGGFQFGDFGDYAVECGEPAPTAPVVCGGATCENPDDEGGYGIWSCIAACCASSGGSQVCGAKDTTVGNEVACQPPPVPDTRCPNYTPQGAQNPNGNGGFDTTLPGCCTATNQCGVISSLRPLCITSSQIIDLPTTPRACDAP